MQVVFFVKCKVLGKSYRAMFAGLLVAVAGSSGHACGASGWTGAAATKNVL